jgi:monothiol glutaredoxin
MRPLAAAWAACSTRSSSPPQPLPEYPAMTDDARTRIDQTVKSNDVVLFMKGTPLFPQCGFSSRAIAILEHVGVEYASVDVLQDQGVRQGIKDYSDWPTIPQLYVKGEFVGGSDIMMEMYESGELQQLMTDQGVATSA